METTLKNKREEEKKIVFVAYIIQQPDSKKTYSNASLTTKKVSKANSDSIPQYTFNKQKSNSICLPSPPRPVLVQFTFSNIVNSVKVDLLFAYNLYLREGLNCIDTTFFL